MDGPIVSVPDAQKTDATIASSLSPQQPPKRKTNIISILALIVVLLAVPLTVVYLGQKTRQEIKAANDCKTPQIPDPADCAGGDWKIYKTDNDCVRFRCTPR